MQKFILVTRSRYRYYSVFTIVIVPTIIIAAFTIPKDFNKIILFVGSVIIMTLVSLIADRYSKQIVEFTISDKELAVNWHSSSFKPNRKNRNVRWDSIKDYKCNRSDDKDFLLFTLFLVNGQRRTFAFSKSEGLGDFNSFYDAFETEWKNVTTTIRLT